MSNHERFRELSALAATGQLSSSEDRELNQHLRECESCREVHCDYSHLIRHQFPKADPNRWRMKTAVSKSAPDAELRERFLARARAEGIDFSVDSERSGRLPHARRWSWWNWPLPVPAFGALALVVLLGIWDLRTHHFGPRPNILAAAQARDNENLSSRLDSLRRTIELESEQLRKMQHDKVHTEESLKEAQRQLLRAQDETKRLSDEVQAADSHNRAFVTAGQEKDTFIADLRAQNDELSRTHADNLSELVLQEQQIRDLNESVDRESMNLERERQLMAATNDVRQLMGARDLHILDVRDVNGDSKSAKPFGRVFYAEGQALVFYAFDLPNGGLTPAKYSFQAWGESAPDSPLPRNLGTFEVDDHQQRRWVLKVKNPDLLAGIHSVFVTSEALHDAKEPRGKKLLYAYIAGQPNHP
jgi:hypothetical protein